MRALKRFLQRLVIFGLGIFSAWFIVFVVFEFADRRLPWSWRWPPPMEPQRTLSFRVSFEWVLKFFSTNGCLVIRLPVMACLVIPSILCLWGHLNSFAPHLRLPVGRRLIHWD